jgi:hypothetical protein
MTVWADLLGVGWIRRLSLSSSPLSSTQVKTFKLAVQLLDLSHQVGIEASDLDARLPEA